MVTIKPECHLCREEINQVVQLKYPNHFKDIYQAICITDILIENADSSEQIEQDGAGLPPGTTPDLAVIDFL
jgi:hypothetical protein